MLNNSIIGYIIKVKQTHLNIDKLTEAKSKTLFSATSNLKFPLDIVGLTLDSDSNIIVPERNEGNLMQLSMNGELLNESNLKIGLGIFHPTFYLDNYLIEYELSLKKFCSFFFFMTILA